MSTGPRKITEGLDAGVEKLINAGVDNLYEAWRDSGAAILYAGELDSTSMASMSLVNSYGVIGFNMTEGNIGRAKLDNIFATNLDEMVSIAFAQRAIALGLNKVEGITGPSWIGYQEVVKSWVYGEMMTYLDNEVLNRLGNSLIIQAEDKASIYSEYGVSVDSDLTSRLIELALTGNVPGKKFLVNGK